jgi:hypothetical protein
MEATQKHICLGQNSTFAKASKISWDIATKRYSVRGKQISKKRSYEERLDYIIGLFLDDYSELSLPDCVTIEELAESVHTIHYLTGKKFPKKHNMASPLVFVEDEEFEDQLGGCFYISDAEVHDDGEAWV